MGGDYLLRVRRHIARRLHLSPVFTRQLASMPLDFANPVWVRAESGRPGPPRRAGRRCRHRARWPSSRPPSPACMHSHSIARDRSGVSTSSRACRTAGWGSITKIHHATLDGASGVALAHATARPRAVAARGRAGAQAPPDQPGLVTHGRHRAQGQRLADRRTWCARLPALARVAARLVTGSTGFSRNLAFGPRTAFNRVIDAVAALRPRRCRWPTCARSPRPTRRR